MLELRYGEQQVGIIGGMEVPDRDPMWTSHSVACKLVLGLAGMVLCGHAAVQGTASSRQIKSGEVTVSLREDGNIDIRHRSLILRLSPRHTLFVARREGSQEFSLSTQSKEADGVPSDYVRAGGKDILDFAPQPSKIKVQEVPTPLGQCQRVDVPAWSATTSLSRILHIDLCSTFPQTAILSATYKNLGSAVLEIDRVVQLAQTLNPPATDKDGIWTFQGASLGWGRDFIFPLSLSFQSQNPIGQPVPGGFGGGIPVNDFWSGETGVGIGHIEPQSVACWMPVETLPTGQVRTWIETHPGNSLGPGEQFTAPRSFITVYRGDFYDGLSTYGHMLRAQGIDFMRTPDDIYNPIWWTFGLGHNFRPDEVYAAIPKLKELGVRWVIINNRWWDHYGDWRPRPDKFGDEAGFKEMLTRLHQEGLRNLLWWMPYAVQAREIPESGVYFDSSQRLPQSEATEQIIHAPARVSSQHRDWLIEDQQGKLVPIARDLAALCPAYPPARDYMVQLGKRMIQEWKADGFYMDVIYTVPPCYNPAHQHTSPYDSTAQLASLFREFRRILEQYCPDGMLMICPCGTTLNYCLLPHMNEAVTADPVGPEQVRWRIKMYKALLGPRAAVHADRVESTHVTDKTEYEDGQDFAAGMGTGGIISSIFVWPRIDKLPGDLEFRGEQERLQALLLTPEKVAHWKKWFDLYRMKKLSTGEFLNLYTLGFDAPEGYAIRKDGKMYYAFFASAPRHWGIQSPPVLPESSHRIWRGRVELRGLGSAQMYRVTDYVNGRDLGNIRGANPWLEIDISDHLLLEVVPQ